MITPTRLSELEVHLDAGGKFTHDNAVELLGCVRGMEWQPMESAPRDGTPILLYYTHGRIELVFWDGKYWTQFCGEGLKVTERDATHWRHLPPAPKTETATNERN